MSNERENKEDDQSIAWLNTQQRKKSARVMIERHKGTWQSESERVWKKWNVDVQINLILALYDSIRLECVPLISRCRHVKYCRRQYASWTNYDSEKATRFPCGGWCYLRQTHHNFSFRFSVCKSPFECNECNSSSRERERGWREIKKNSNNRIENPQSACIFHIPLLLIPFSIDSM